MKEPDAVCVSKSEVSRRFVKELSALMDEFFNRRIDEDYPIMMPGGMAVGKMTVIAAMGIGRDGCKRMPGLCAGGTENQVAVKELLADLLPKFNSPFGVVAIRISSSRIFTLPLTGFCAF